MPILTQQFIYRKNLKARPEWFFVFGDNDIREGFGGQAKEMRGEPNSIGIRTKALPSTSPDSYWSDDNYEENVEKINEDLKLIKQKLENGLVVVFPEAGIGTGYAKLNEKAPLTYAYLQQSLDDIFSKYLTDVQPNKLVDSNFKLATRLVLKYKTYTDMALINIIVKELKISSELASIILIKVKEKLKI